MRRLFTVLASIVLITSAAAAPALAQATGGEAIKPKGLFLEVGLGGQMSVYNGVTGNNQQLGGSFLIGYKLRRLVLGLGLEYVHLGTWNDNGGGGADPDHEVINAMIFQPTVQFHLVESAPMALYLTGGVHVGFAVYDETGTTVDDDTSTALVGFHLGLGIRYFLHPRFALGVEAGFRGLWVLMKYDPDGPGSSNQTQAQGAFYGRLGFAAIW